MVVYLRVANEMLSQCGRLQLLARDLEGDSEKKKKPPLVGREPARAKGRFIAC